MLFSELRYPHRELFSTSSTPTSNSHGVSSAIPLVFPLPGFITPSTYSGVETQTSSSNAQVVSPTHQNAKLSSSSSSQTLATNGQAVSPTPQNIDQSSSSSSSLAGQHPQHPQMEVQSTSSSFSHGDGDSSSLNPSSQIPDNLHPMTTREKSGIVKADCILLCY